MPKFRYEWTQQKYERYLKEGRGQGTKKDYKPWITVQSTSSKGLSSRVPGWKTNRLHHFLSQHELRYFYLLEWSNIVIDIREQFPLENIERAQQIAVESDIKYPTDKQTKLPYILTTDFMITIVKDDKTIDIARTIKPAKDLDKKRVIEKFEIERRYWKEQDVGWGIVTELDIPVQISRNIMYVHGAKNLEPLEDLTVDDQLYIAERLKEYLIHEKDATIRRILGRADKELKIERGTSLKIFKYLIANKEISMDMTKKIWEGSQVSDIQNIVLDVEKVRKYE